MRPPPDEKRDAEVRAALARAANGDLEAYGWLVELFTPLLVASARRRHATNLKARFDPEDVVQDVWVRSLPHLTRLDTRGCLSHVAVLQYLTVAIANRYRDLAQRRATIPLADMEVSPDDPTASTTGVITRAARNEQSDQLRIVLEGLDPVDRDILVMRGIDQAPATLVGEVLNMTPNSVSKRYRRLLVKLRKKVPPSLRDLFAREQESPD